MENENSSNGNGSDIEYMNMDRFGKISTTQMIFDDGGSILQHSVDVFAEKDGGLYAKERHKLNIKADDLDAWKNYVIKVVDEAKKNLKN